MKEKFTDVIVLFRNGMEWNGNDTYIARQLHEQGACIMAVLRRWQHSESKFKIDQVKLKIN